MPGNKTTSRSVHRKGLKPRPKRRGSPQPIPFVGVPDVSAQALFASEREMILEEFAGTQRAGMEAWAADHVRFTKEYQACVFEGPWDPNLTPFWLEPMEMLGDRHTREVKVLKCSQAGATENLALMFMRYSAAVLHWSMLLVLAQEVMAKTFFNDRLVGGIRHCVDRGPEIMERADVKWSDLIARWPDFMFRVGWAKSKAVMKGDPWRIMLLDEVSTYPGDAMDKLRKRMGTWQGLGKLLIMSAMDKEGKRPASEDPMLLEFLKSDQRAYMFPDKRGADRFRFEMGYNFEKRILMPYGLKWSEKAKRKDGSWDLDAVEESAYYRTPAGRKITTEQRNRMLRNRDGLWVPQNPDHTDREKGYHVTSFMLPWVSFGNLARRFIAATSPAVNKAKLRILVLEDLAEEWIDQKTTIRDDELKDRRGAYKPNEIMSEVEPYKSFYIGAERMVFGSFDVQQKHFRYVIREWLKGDFENHRIATGLIVEGKTITWESIDLMCDEWGVDYVLMDNNYDQRKTEVLQNCATRPGFITCEGHDARMKTPFQKLEMNPYEGTRRAREGARVPLFQYDSDNFRTALVNMIQGTQEGVEWRVPLDYTRSYWREVLSTEKKDGIWGLRPGFGQDHAFDCETLQVLAATTAGMREWN